MKMDDLSTLAPQMAAGASPEVFHQLGLITRQLHDTLTQLGVMPKLQTAADGQVKNYRDWGLPLLTTIGPTNATLARIERRMTELWQDAD